MNSLDEINQRLFKAVEHGDTELALSLIEQGAYVNQKDRSGNTPLETAAEHGHTELALSLIEHGASVNQVTYGCAPLDIAVSYGRTVLALSLIEHGASVNQQGREQSCSEVGTVLLFFMVILN